MALSLQRYTSSDYDSDINCFLKQRSMRERERSAHITVKNGVCLPEDLIIEILSRLPVKALLQYKSVCKSWFAIISRPRFVSLHLQNYYNNNDDCGCCLLLQSYAPSGKLRIFEVLVDDTPQVLGCENLHDMPCYGSFVCGPCDGLYYLYDEWGDHSLWNPAINKLKVLPRIYTEPDSSYAHGLGACGFGLDPVTRDYKVVVIEGYCRTDDEDVNKPMSIFVYLVRTDSWRYCGDLDQNYDFDNKCYTYVSGRYYWLGTRFSRDDSIFREVIISFDMATDACEEIPLPNYEQPAFKSLGVYDKSVAFLSVHEYVKTLDTWTLDKGVWTKKFIMGPYPELERPLGNWKEDMILLVLENRKLVLCDLSTQDIKDLGYTINSSWQRICFYKESLVSFKDWVESERHQGAVIYLTGRHCPSAAPVLLLRVDNDAIYMLRSPDQLLRNPVSKSSMACSGTLSFFCS